MKGKLLIIFILFLVLFGIVSWNKVNKKNAAVQSATDELDQGGLLDKAFEKTHPLQITQMRKKEYPGSTIVIEETLSTIGSYATYIASYTSEGLKQFALLTIPNGEPPHGGWPVIVFNHGFIQPEEYRTNERYVAYVDAFARNGYVVFKPDYRGHGSSEGNPEGGYGSPAYTVDVLNAVSSIKKYKNVNPQKIGMWGHSMGGHITLRSMVVTKDIKAGVIWGGVVANYQDLLNNWRRRSPSMPPLTGGARRWRQALVDEYGTPESNKEFWDSISPNHYVSEISGPIQLHHGTADESVPLAFPESLRDQLQAAHKTVEYYTYPGDDHNISGYFSLAMQRSVSFFDTYLKSSP